MAPLVAKDQSLAQSQAYCRNGNWGKFYELLRGNPLLLSARDAEGHTPLHWFALNNHREAVKKLLSIGAEVRGWQWSAACACVCAGWDGGGVSCVQVPLARGCGCTRFVCVLVGVRRWWIPAFAAEWLPARLVDGAVGRVFGSRHCLRGGAVCL